jgi:hypothetical protein
MTLGAMRQDPISPKTPDFMAIPMTRALAPPPGAAGTAFPSASAVSSSPLTTVSPYSTSAMPWVMISTRASVAAAPSPSLIPIWKSVAAAAWIAARSEGELHVFHAWNLSPSDVRASADLAEAEYEALVEERDELKAEVQSLQLGDDASAALSDWLVANGYPSRPLRVDCPRLQRLVDIIGT